MTLVNLTPHVINVILEGSALALPTSGQVARVSSKSEKVGEAAGVPLFATTFGEVVDLPQPEEGVLYVVSAMVRAALSSRTDLASPGDPVRDGEGKVIGCRGLIVNR